MNHFPVWANFSERTQESCRWSWYFSGPATWSTSTLLLSMLCVCVCVCVCKHTYVSVLGWRTIENLPHFPPTKISHYNHSMWLCTCVCVCVCVFTPLLATPQVMDSIPVRISENWNHTGAPGDSAGTQNKRNTYTCHKSKRREGVLKKNQIIYKLFIVSHKIKTF